MIVYNTYCSEMSCLCYKASRKAWVTWHFPPPINSPWYCSKISCEEKGYIHSCLSWSCAQNTLQFKAELAVCTLDYLFSFKIPCKTSQLKCTSCTWILTTWWLSTLPGYKKTYMNSSPPGMSLTLSGSL